MICVGVAGGGAGVETATLAGVGVKVGANVRTTAAVGVGASSPPPNKMPQPLNNKVVSATIDQMPDRHSILAIVFVPYSFIACCKHKVPVA